MSSPLIVRLPNWIGDVVMAVPALRLLESCGYELHLTGKAWAADLLAGERWPIAAYPRRYFDRIRLLKDLAGPARRQDRAFDRHDNALLFTKSFSSAWEMRAAGLRATGFRTEARRWLLGRSLPLPRDIHKLRSYWRLADIFAGAAQEPPPHIDLRVDASAGARAQELRRAHDLWAGYIVICPFAHGVLNGRSKRWPLFVHFARQAREQLGFPVVLCPGPGETADAHADFADAIVLSGVNLGEYAALMQHAALVVSNDTGPGHIAAAVGAPLLSVLGPTDPSLYGPWGTQVGILREKEGWPSVEAVLEAARTLIAQWQRPNPYPGQNR